MYGSTAARFGDPVVSLEIDIVRSPAGSTADSTMPLWRRIFAWIPWRSSAASDDGWERLASFAIGRRTGEQHVTVQPATGYRLLKLRAPSTDLDVRRLVLEFSDGNLQDLSIGTLLRGTESRPASVAGRDLAAIVLEYRDRAGIRGKVEVWAQS